MWSDETNLMCELYIGTSGTSKTENGGNDSLKYNQMQKANAVIVIDEI